MTDTPEKEECSHSDYCVTCKGISLKDRGFVFCNFVMYDEEDGKHHPVLDLRKEMLQMAYDRTPKIRPSLSDDITLTLDSPGGTIDDGLALFSTIKRIQAMGIKVNGHIDGNAASMATVVLQAMDHRTMSRYAWMLIHNITGGVHGRGDQIEDMQKMFKLYGTTLAQIYADRTGYKDAAWWRKWYHSNERVITAQEALDLGLIDEIV